MRFFCLCFQKLETSRAPWRATRETKLSVDSTRGSNLDDTGRYRALLYRQLHSARAPALGGRQLNIGALRQIRRIERGLVLSIRTAAPACMPIFSDHSLH
jgi:hypothetical protein